MKKIFFVLAFLAAVVAVSPSVSAAQRVDIEVSSIKELLPLLKKSNMNVVVRSGIYRVSPKDVHQGMYREYTESSPDNKIHTLFLVEGSDNTFDFTDVTIEIETAVANAFEGKYDDFYQLHIVGNNNTIKNLTLVDVGELSDFPKYGACNVVVDGANNTLDGVEVRSQGSMPYGYGEIFGKGRIKTMPLKKHSSCLVRGDYNTMRNCRVIHHAFGHFIFMQAAKNPTIEGCYIEGLMGTTDDILAEKGTGSSADKIDFKTIWGYQAPKGYTLALGEDGIRTYNRGTTIINGQQISRGTNDVTVRDCIIKHARGGVSLTLSSGSKIVENCTLIGCQGGINVGSGGKIINCKADVAFGPAFSVAYDKDKNITADITIIPYEGEKFVGNGSRQAAYIIGSDHNIILRKGEGLAADDELEICIGGDNRSVGQLAADEDLAARGIRLDNHTDFKVVIDDKATNSHVSSVGKIIDYGTANTIIKK